MALPLLCEYSPHRRQRHFLTDIGSRSNTMKSSGRLLEPGSAGKHKKWLEATSYVGKSVDRIRSDCEDGGRGRRVEFCEYPFWEFEIIILLCKCQHSGNNRIQHKHLSTIFTVENLSIMTGKIIIK